MRLKKQRQCPQLNTYPSFQSLPNSLNKFTILSAKGEGVEIINLSEDVPDFGELYHFGRNNCIDVIIFVLVLTSSVGSTCISFSNRFMNISFSPEDVERANEVWNCQYTDLPTLSHQKVTFHQPDSIYEFEDNNESKDCRIGTWACDGARFMTKINDIRIVLSPILSPEHRQSVYEQLNSSPLPE